MRKHTLVRIAAILLPIGLLAAGPGARAADAADGPGLEDALRATGWQVQRLADGGLELRLSRAPAPRAPATRPSRAAEPQTEADAWDRLRARGWRVDRAENGSILLFPPAPAAAAGTSAAETSPPPKPLPTHERPPATMASARLDDMEAALRARGWRAEREPDGSLLAYPLARSSRKP